MMHVMNGVGFGSVGMFVWMFLQWALLILGIYFLIRWIRADKDRPEDQALHILRERFAKGEISEEEYTHKKKTLV